MSKLAYLSVLLFFCSCQLADEKSNDNLYSTQQETEIVEPSLLVLGTVQDAGSPHTACTKECCADLFDQPKPDRMVVSLGIIDPGNKQSWLFEATPDFPRQMKLLKNHAPFKTEETPDGIFLTHAHIGHYTGLMYLGRESMGARSVPVYVMPKMKSFLENNGPWSQLVELNNIELFPLKNEETITLSSNIQVTPIRVPHRDEYSETIGFIIHGPTKKVLFIPDIDKWEKWDRDIINEIQDVDYAFLDATFYDGDEINNRDISEIPHPFVIESMKLFNDLPENEKKKIFFIHLNHTNPLLIPQSDQAGTVTEAGYNIATFGELLPL